MNHVSGVQVVLKSCEYPGDSGDISLQVFYGFLGKTGKKWLRYVKILNLTQSGCDAHILA